jgi:hypothetical protein
MKTKLLKKKIEQEDFQAVYSYKHGAEEVVIYKRDGLVLEAVYGKRKAHELNFSDANGEPMSFRNFLTGRKWYSEKVQREAALCLSCQLNG